MATTSKSTTSTTSKTSTPTVNGKTFAQASAGVTDRATLGKIAQQFQSVSGGSSSSNSSSNNSSGGSGDGIVRYNPNTGALLQPGETVINKYTGEKVTQGTKYIAASDLGKNNALDIPTAPTYGTDYNTILGNLGLSGADNKKAVETTGSTALDNALGTQSANFKAYLDNLQAPPSMEDAYRQAQRETGIAEKQKLVNDLSVQLGNIQANATANQLRLEGQGRGIPDVIIGGQQAQIAREAAIQALPVSAQLQAAQGNLEMAQQNLDTLFKIKSADLTAQYEYKNNLVKSVYDFASGQEKANLDYAMKMEDRKYQETMSEQQDIKQLASTAMTNGAPASILRAISSAKTYKEALAAIGKYGTDPLDRAIKQLALKKAQKDLEDPADNGLIDEKILNSTQFKNAQAAINLKNTLNKAKEAVAKYGNKEKLNATGRGILDTLKVQLRSEISTALEQGVVVPGEAAAFDAIAGQLNKSFFIRNSKTMASLDSLISSMDSRLNTQKSALQSTYGLTEAQFNNSLGILPSDMNQESYIDFIDTQLSDIHSPYASYFK